MMAQVALQLEVFYFVARCGIADAAHGVGKALARRLLKR